MGLRGPAPKPTLIRQIEGNPSKRPLNKNEPKHESGIPKAPRFISKRARSIYKDMADGMDPRLLCLVDQTALWQLAEDTAILREAYAGFWKMAEAIKHKAQLEGKELPAGEVMALLNMSNGRLAMRAIAVLAGRTIIERREFGLTPSSRSRISAGGEFQSTLDPLELKLCG